MSLVLVEGFDNSMAGPGVSVSVGGTGPVTSWVAGRLGGVAVRGHGTSGTPLMTVTAVMPAANSVATCGVACYGTGNALQNGTVFLSAREGGTTHVGVRRSSSTGLLEIVRGDLTVLGTTAIPIAAGVWNHYDLSVYVHDSAGYAVLRVNDEELIRVENVDTRNGGTLGVVDRFVCVSSGMSATTGSTAFYVDDIYITDGVGPAPLNGSLGDTKIDLIRPNGNGATSDWVGSDANSVDNYLLVDDASTTTDYVGSPTVGARDLYEVTSPASSAEGDILAVVPVVLAAKSDAGAAPGPLLVAARALDGTVVTEQVAAAAQLTTVFQWFVGVPQVVDPAGDPWTQARIDGLQLGVEVGA